MIYINAAEDMLKVGEMLKGGAKKTIRCMVLIPIIIALQLRSAFSQGTAKKYAVAQKDGVVLPPANGNLDLEAMEVYCYDGAHRLEAAKLNGETHLLMELTLGTKREATLNAAGVNEEHGLPRTKEDKRNSVETILADSEWRSRSSSWIAQVTHTSVPYVEELRKRADKAAGAQEGESAAPKKRRVMRGGKEYEMTIPTKPAKDPVDVILARVVKLAQTLDDTDRSRLSRAIVDALGGDAA